MWTRDFKRIPSDTFRTFPAFPAVTSVDFTSSGSLHAPLVLRTFRIQSPYHPYLIRTACEHFPTLPHHDYSLSTLPLSTAFFSRVSFCLAFVRIPHHYHVLCVRITSASIPSISGLIITTIPLALLTPHFHAPHHVTDWGQSVSKVRTRCGMCIIPGQVNPYFPAISGRSLCVPYAFLHFRSSGTCIRAQEIRKSTAGIPEVNRNRPTPPMSFSEVYWCVFSLSCLLFTCYSLQTRIT